MFSQEPKKNSTELPDIKNTAVEEVLITAKQLELENTPDGKPSTSTSSLENTEPCISENSCDSESSTEEPHPIKFSIRTGVFSDIINIFVAPSQHSTVEEKLYFLSKHPLQPTYTEYAKLPFKPTVYKRQLPNGECVLRNWLSFSVHLRKLFCSICMAFSQAGSVFTQGMEDFRHTYQRVQEHESSSCHSLAVEGYFAAKNRSNIEYKINYDLMNLRRDEIVTNRLIVRRIIDIILFIVKQNISYRGKDESSALLNKTDLSVKRGNFLELCLLLSQYDDILKNHIQKISKTGQSKISKKGRGGAITFLSKTTVNKVISVLADYVRNKISFQIQDAKKFSVQVDSTQDISVREQCAIVARYVYDGKVNERLLYLIDVKKSTGLNLYTILKEQLKKINLEVYNIIGCSFDGAANMSGEYNGLQAHIKNNTSYSVYTWCYAHVLNLVVCDTTESSVNCKNLFGLLNRTANFLSESYKRNAVWKDKIGKNNFKKLKKISNTRWWSKSKALETIFDSYRDQTNELYSTLLLVLYTISTDIKGDFDGKTSSEAQSLLHSWTNFETLILSFIFMFIFHHLTPASNYLQTKGLDFHQAFHIIKNAKESIAKMFDQFASIHEKVIKFINDINDKDCFGNADIFIETEFPRKRQRKIKKMPGEKSFDEIIFIDEQGSLKKFEIENYKVIINQVTRSLSNRFTDHETIYKEFFYFDPRNFTYLCEQNEENLPANAFSSISMLTGISSATIKKELISFAQNFKEMKGAPASKHAHTSISSTSSNNTQSKDHSSSDTDSDDCDENMFSENNHIQSSCAGCLVCCFQLIHKHNLHSLAYSNLYIAYKYLLTLSCTQVTCERVFSKLKIILTRLRSLLGQERLDAFILLSVESDLLQDLDYDLIIDNFASNSSLLKTKLLI